MNHIYIVQYESDDDGSTGAYVPYDTTDRTFDAALAYVTHLRWMYAKCYGIVNDGKLVYQTSQYYQNANLPIRNS